MTDNIFLRGARPIQDPEIQNHHDRFDGSLISLDQYQSQWRTWLTQSSSKCLQGLEEFPIADAVNGTSHAFDQFFLLHSTRIIAVMPGEFQYHACLGKHRKFQIIDSPGDLRPNHALIISAPFSDTGDLHPNWISIMSVCESLGIPVCLDLAYWGIAKNISIDLRQWRCITTVTSSLSKPFWTLENHRVGIRFCRAYPDDGISMINEVNMQNLHSMALGSYFMRNFSSDWAWIKYQSAYDIVCQTHNLTPTNTVIFALGDDRHPEFCRGIPNNYRLCISRMLCK